MPKATPLRVNLQQEDDGGTVVIELFDYISPYWGFSAVELADRLKSLSGVNTIRLRVHSRGGDAMEGFAIYSILQSHSARVEAEIIGVAASAASVVVMAADPGSIRISELGFVMIHDPWAFADGNATVLRRVAELLENISPSIVRAYRRHSTLSPEEIAEAMAVGEGAGTWYDAEAAVASGFADEVMEPVAVPENSALRLGDLSGVPQAALELFGRRDGEPAPEPGDREEDPLVAEILEELRAAGRNAERITDGHDDTERVLDLLETLMVAEDAEEPAHA